MGGVGLPWKGFGAQRGEWVGWGGAESGSAGGGGLRQGTELEGEQARVLTCGLGYTTSSP